MGINVLSLFDGISCGQVALERAEIKIDCYFASEVNKNSIKITQKNYPNTIQLGDVRNIIPKNLPTIDLLIGGSPCQGFSFAGERLNFEHNESKLFFEFVKLLEELKPRYFLLENVKMKQEWLNIISEKLGVNPMRINSELVSAQHRDRYYWTNIPGITQPEDKEILFNDILNPVGEDQWLLRDKARNRALNNPRSRIVNRETKKSPALLLNQGKQATDSVSILENDGTIRWLSRNECERLQTLPEGYTNSVAKCEAIKCIGDGWTVDVIAHIFSNINEEFALQKQAAEVKT